MRNADDVLVEAAAQPPHEIAHVRHNDPVALRFLAVTLWVLTVAGAGAAELVGVVALAP
ncbi:hypothetical protein [Streptomyces sp. NPDC058739]|uniref:hypothetical protein n=1 Tax=Streptomyces sp. NPDC058739 TaxID=3346618 RepID=UPI003690AFE2